MSMVTINRHGGNLRELAQLSGRPAKDILDFSANINPLGPPEWMRTLISSQIDSLIHYPDPDCTELRKVIASRYQITPDEVLIGNGSTEILHLLPGALRLARAVIPVPSYSDYAVACELAGLEIKKLTLKETDGFEIKLPDIESALKGKELVFIGQPNNPTGFLCRTDDILSLARKNPSTFFLIDEAFADFVDGIDSFTKHRFPNIIVLRSLTKFYAIPGLRLGFVIADRHIIGQLQKFLPPWSVNTLAQTVGKAVFDEDDYARHTRELVRVQRQNLIQELRAISGLTIYPGKANFLLMRIDRSGVNAPILAQRLLQDGIAIRVCDNFEGLDSRFFRLAVRTEAENSRLCESIKIALGVSKRSLVKRRTSALMFQGTSSNAGKSVLTAALCRILIQDGYRVAPFKAQNMSLNSYVTREGGEMGRAQVVQAQACRLDPDVRMNPILLKPNSDMGSQVIVLGKPIGNMEVQDYINYKPELFKTVKKAYDSLASEYDVLVLEGAGSPAEVNLKHHDIVNMSMALHAGSPVLLVGDIDRGGLFASFIGTVQVLSQWERALIAGFVINRFRGQEALLQGAIDYTARYTGFPTFGVIPHLQDLGLPEEDSVTFKNGRFEGPRPAGDYVDIAVIDLPHIANFTDFDPLRIEPDVYLRVVRTAKDLGAPDAVILPGSKNVIGDLKYLRETGLDRHTASLAATGRTEVVGLCAGFQILGNELSDPYGIESKKQTLRGLGLLPLSTVLERKKTLTCVSAKHLESGLAVKGYEIHHGKSNGMNLTPTVIREDGEIIGAGSKDTPLWGTYLHGIFDADGFRRWFIDRLRIRKGLSPLQKICAVYDLEPAFDRLADIVRNNLRIDEIYKLIGL